MKSLPVISHRLFVAAIGNESRAHDKPRPLEKPSFEAAGQAASVTVEVAHQAMPILQGGLRPIQASTPQARA
jgi:hypothetical protein